MLTDAEISDAFKEGMKLAIRQIVVDYVTLQPRQRERFQGLFESRLLAWSLKDHQDRLTRDEQVTQTVPPDAAMAASAQADNH